MAKLYFRYGAMNSSKTANALMVKYNYEEQGQSVIITKPAVASRAFTIMLVFILRLFSIVQFPFFFG